MTVLEKINDKYWKQLEGWDNYSYAIDSPISLDDKAEIIVYLFNRDTTKITITIPF